MIKKGSTSRKDGTHSFNSRSRSTSSSSRPTQTRSSITRNPYRYARDGESSHTSSSSSSSYRGSSTRTSSYDGRSQSSGGRSFSSSQSRFGGRGGFSSSRGPSSGGRGRSRASSRTEKIDISKFIYTPENLIQEKYINTHKFTDFPLSPILQKNIAKRGFLHPTAIQDKIINPGLEGKDVIGLASTGSGKTGAFLIPIIENITKNKTGKALIIAPTRELAQQINKELREFVEGLPIYSTVCVGGMPIYRQIQELRRTHQFVIGTPGRIKDLHEKKCINFSEFNYVVLDEVDRMLDMGFVDEIKRVLSLLPADHQSFFFSATMPSKIQTLMMQFLTDPVTVDISTGDSTKSVHQDVVRVGTGDKIGTLINLLNKAETEKTLIFVETKHEVDKLQSTLEKAGFRTGLLHGGRRQNERERTLQKFREGDIQILVATDVAARGIDVKDISHVINYTIPQTHHDYIHRIGRTGRGGKTGKALTFI